MKVIKINIEEYKKELYEKESINLIVNLLDIKHEQADYLIKKKIEHSFYFFNEMNTEFNIIILEVKAQYKEVNYNNILKTINFITTLNLLQYSLKNKLIKKNMYYNLKEKINNNINIFDGITFFNDNDLKIFLNKIIKE